MGNQQLTPCFICYRDQQKLTECGRCHHLTCRSCRDYPIFKKQQITKLNQIQLIDVCKNCFLSNTKLDFSQTEELIGLQNNKQIIFVPGGGSSRKMFELHAKMLTKHGFKSILIDLPSFGSRLNQKLTLDSAISVIKEAAEAKCSKDVILIGGSMGGYLIIETLGRYPFLCRKAVIMMCGQNIGFNRSLKASFGLWAMNKGLAFTSQLTMIKYLIQSVAKNENINQLSIIELLKSGYYFKQGAEQVELLKSTNTLQNLQKMEEKVKFLFINGSKDYRDSEEIFLKAAGKNSKLLIYEQGDHFFSHDNRFIDRLVNDIVCFSND